MDYLRFYVLFNSISVISGRWADDNERLCAMEFRLRLRRFRLERGRTWTARSVGQRLTRRANGASLIDRWIDDFSFLRPSRQYFNHIRMIKRYY